MIELYKILTKKYDEIVANFIELNDHNQNTRGHNLKIKKNEIKIENTPKYLCKQKHGHME